MTVRQARPERFRPESPLHAQRRRVIHTECGLLGTCNVAGVLAGRPRRWIARRLCVSGGHRQGAAQYKPNMTYRPARPGRPRDDKDLPESAGLAIRPPSWLDRAVEAATIATKAVTLACAVDALVNANSPRLRGKAIRTRAIGYTAGLALVPVAWRLLPDRGRYPRGLDLAVTVPLMIDAGGNALGLYEEAHLDDVVHVLNATILGGLAAALFAGRVDEPWHAAVAGATTTITAELAWEVAEFTAMKAGADGMNLTYEDTIADIIESSIGAIVGAIAVWLRMPRAKSERRRGGWRHAVAGWRQTGEPISIVGRRGTVAEAIA